MSASNGSAPAAAPTSTADATSQVENLISLHLHLWPALTVAIQNAWGTSSPALGEDKRAWFAGAISELFTSNQIRDVEDLEDIMEQVMSDEFEVVVDDDSLEETARKIWQGRQKVLQGDPSEVTRLMAVWEEKQKKKTKYQVVAGPEINQDTDEEVDEDEEEVWDGFQDTPDVNMRDAPAEPRRRPEPEVDEDGFTTVRRRG